MKPIPWLIASAAVASTSLAADPRGDHPDAKPLTAAEQLKRFKVPAGFEVQLVASEPAIQKPVNLNFDGSGRLWVTGSELYPWPAATDAVGKDIPGFAKVYEEIAGAFGSAGKAPPIERAGKDTIRVLSEFGGDGGAGQIHIFADGLNIPTGILPLPRDPEAKGDSVIAYSIPNIWRFDDTTGDGKADRRIPLYSGFGYLDTHGMSSNYVHWLDGWIYGCHGFRNQSDISDVNGNILSMNSGNTYRFKPDGSKIEYWSNGQTNPFGLAFDSRGNLYSADSHSKPVYLLQRGGFYEGIGKQHDGLGFAPRVTDDDHGSSAIAGIMYYSDKRWPAEFHDNVFNGNPVTQRVNRATLEWHGSSPKATRVEDFLSCDDPWFRPVQVKLGPDGALYIADFYNPVIGHYELPLNHPSRDRTHGRIWRVVWKGGDVAHFPDLAELGNEELVRKLGDPNIEARRLAVHEVSSRLTSSDSDLSQRVRDTLKNGTPEQQAGALWALVRDRKDALSSLGPEIWENASPLLKLHYLRVLAERGFENPRELMDAARGNDPAIHRAVAEGIGRHPSERGLTLLVEALKVPQDDQDVQLAYARRIALREILKSPDGFGWVRAVDLGSARQTVAEVSLAVPTPEAAGFLIDHLHKTEFSAPRANEFLRHIAHYHPADRLGEVVEMVGREQVPQSLQLAFADGLDAASRSRGISLDERVVAWMQRMMMKALSEPDQEMVARAIAAMREAKFPEKVAPLAAIASDRGRPEPLRVAALEALANQPAATSILLSVVSDAANPLRKRAVELLGQRMSPPIAVELAAAMAAAPRELETAIAAALAKSDAGAGALLDAVEEGKASTSVLRHQSVSGPIAERPERLTQRAATLAADLPPEDERLDQVIAGRAAALRDLAPDSERGATVFKQQCAACHKYQNSGGNIGPNLDGMAARGTQRLLEDILDPNRNVDPAFRQVLLETHDGRVIAGVNPRVSGELLVLSDAEGKELSVGASEVKSRKNSQLSLMPAVFEQTLSTQDLADLLAYLTET